MLTPVESLSDDDQIASSSSAPGNNMIVPCAKRAPAKKRSAVVALQPPPGVDIKSLRHRVQGACGCLCGCFKPFRFDDDLFGRLVSLRKTLSRLEKVEQDKYVRSSVSKVARSARFIYFMFGDQK